MTILTAMCGLVPFSTVAQETPPSDKVPEELVLSLLGGPGAGEKAPDILVGTVPGWFPKDFILPADARVLGSQAYGKTRARVIVATSTSPGTLVAEYRRTLSGQGWTVPDESAEREGGFVGQRSKESVEFCRQGTALQVSPKSAKNGRILLHLVYEKELSRSHSCNRDGDVRHSRAETKVPIPVLASPEGVTFVEGIVGRGGRTSSDRWGRVYASVETALGASELATRYGKQLREQDWTLEKKRNTDGLAAWYWHLKDEESGRRWTGLFTVVAVPDSSGQKYRLGFETWKPGASE